MPPKTKAKVKVLISHTHSAKNRKLQLADLRRHYKERKQDIKNVDVEYLPDGPTTPERSKVVAEWVAANQDGYTYRNQVLTPCLRSRKTGVKKQEPKKEDK